MTDTVLYIDNEPELPARIEDVLAQAGYRLLHTADPDEALRIVREEPVKDSKGHAVRISRCLAPLGPCGCHTSAMRLTIR